MFTATVYTIDDNNIVVDQFDVDYDFAIQRYFGTRTNRGRYYVSKKGVKIPFKFKNKILKSIMPSHESEVQE